MIDKSEEKSTQESQQEQGNKYDQSGPTGIGHISDSEISGNAKVSGTYIENLTLRYEHLLTQADASSLNGQEENITWRGKKITDDHKYNGELAFINIGFAEKSEQTKEIEIRLNITFGQASEKIKFESGKETYIRFGINYGTLELILPNDVEIPLHKRNLHSDPENKWRINCVGVDKAPIWQFSDLNKDEILQGTRINKKLGSFESLNPSDYVEVVFKVEVNFSNIKITAPDYLCNKNDKGSITKIQTFLKSVKPKLEEYVSKFVLQYD